MKENADGVWMEFGTDTRNMTYPVDMKLDDVYSKLVELTDGEEDKELYEYNEYLLDSIQEAISYIHELEKRVRKHAQHRETLQGLRATCDTCKNHETETCRDCGLEHILNQWQIAPDLI